MQIPVDTSFEDTIQPAAPAQHKRCCSEPLACGPRGAAVAAVSLNTVLRRRELSFPSYRPVVGEGSAGCGRAGRPGSRVGWAQVCSMTLFPLLGAECPPRARASDDERLELKRQRQNTQACLRPLLLSCPSNPTGRGESPAQPAWMEWGVYCPHNGRKR